MLRIPACVRSNFYLKCEGVGGHHVKNREDQPNFSLVKVYFSNHAITNNLNKENGICIKSLLILKEVNIVVLHSIVRMVEKLLEEPSWFYRLEEMKVPVRET